MSPLAELTTEQLELRKTGLGASEVAAVLGLDPYRTALDVYLEKTGQLEPSPANRFTHWGKRLEAVIAEEYAERHPDRTLLPSPTLVHPLEKWMLATPDRRVVFQKESKYPGVMMDDDPLKDRGLEIKCRGIFDRDAWGEEGSDEVPHAVALQCHWGMAVSGLQSWDVAVLLGGNDYREYTLGWNETIAFTLVAKASQFWHDNVLAKKHPPFTGADSDHAFLLRAYPNHSDEIVQATPAIGELADLLRVYRESRAKYDDECSRLETQLKEFIGGRRGVKGPGFQVTWTYMKETEVKAFTRPANRRLLCKFDKPTTGAATNGA